MANSFQPRPAGLDLSGKLSLASFLRNTCYVRFSIVEFMLNRGKHTLN